MKYVLSEGAEFDLDSIWEFIAQDNFTVRFRMQEPIVRWTYFIWRFLGNCPILGEEGESWLSLQK